MFLCFFPNCSTVCKHFLWNSLFLPPSCGSVFLIASWNSPKFYYYSCLALKNLILALKSSVLGMLAYIRVLGIPFTQKMAHLQQFYLTRLGWWHVEWASRALCWKSDAPWDLAAYILWLNNSLFQRDLIIWKGRLLVSPGAFLALANPPPWNSGKQKILFRLKGIIYSFLGLFLDFLH